MKSDIGHLETVNCSFHSLLIMMIKAESYKIFSEIYNRLIQLHWSYFGDGYRSVFVMGCHAKQYIKSQNSSKVKKCGKLALNE